MTPIKELLKIAFYVAATFYYAFILKCLWGWYIIPWIDSAPQLPYVVAIGIMLIAKLLTYQFTVNDSIYLLNLFKTPKEDIAKIQKEASTLNIFRSLMILLVNTAFLLCGWLYHFLM